MPRELLFADATMRRGLNVTVRNGARWLSLKTGEEIALRTTDGRDIAPAHVVCAQFGAFDEFPDFVFRFHHGGGGTREAVRAALDAVYGADRWGPFVTVVWFWIDDGEAK